MPTQPTTRLLNQLFLKMVRKDSKTAYVSLANILETMVIRLVDGEITPEEARKSIENTLAKEGGANV